MRSHAEHLTFHVPKQMDFVNITPQVQQAVANSGVREGLCLVNDSVAMTSTLAVRHAISAPGSRASTAAFSA